MPALTVAGGTELPATAHIAAVAERLRLVNRQLKEVERNIDRLIASLPGEVTDPGEPLAQSPEQRDAVILRSFPGVGRTALATLLAEANQALHARGDHALRTLCRAAPVTKSSGKSIRVERRQACSDRLREALYHWARVATEHDLVSKARYAALRTRGHTHGRALRGIGDRLLAVACAMLKTQTTFELREPKLAGTQPQNSP